MCSRYSIMCSVKYLNNNNIGTNTSPCGTPCVTLLEAFAKSKRTRSDLPNLQGKAYNWGWWGILFFVGRTCLKVWSLFWWRARCWHWMMTSRHRSCLDGRSGRWSCGCWTSCSRNTDSRLWSSSWSSFSIFYTLVSHLSLVISSIVYLIWNKWFVTQERSDFF